MLSILPPPNASSQKRRMIWVICLVQCVLVIAEGPLGNIGSKINPYLSQPKQCRTDLPQSRMLFDKSALNIWDRPVAFDARYPYTEVWPSGTSTFTLNYTSTTLQTDSGPKGLDPNPINGLFFVNTLDTGNAAIQTICDQAAIRLLRLLNANASQFASINSPLPNNFFADTNVQSQECTAHRPFGLKLLARLDAYQKDCLSICVNSSQTSLLSLVQGNPPPSDLLENVTIGYRKSLGSPFDALFDNTNDPSIPVEARGLSNVLSRIVVCAKSGWYESDINAKVGEVFKMCASTVECAALCAGDLTDAKQNQLEYGDLYNTSINLAFALTPSEVLAYVQPITQVLNMLAEYIPQNLAGTAVESYIDSQTKPTGNCSNYDAVMSAFRSATGGSQNSPFPDHGPSTLLPKVRESGRVGVGCGGKKHTR